MSSSHPFPRSVALIGAGYWGKNLARNLSSLGVLHTLCDKSSALLSQYKELYPDLHLTTSFEEVLADPAITALFIAAPAIQHAELAKRALLAKKHVFVEKPLCLTVHEAKELIVLAEKEKRTLMVGHLLQYHPCVESMQKMIAEGMIGSLQYIISHRMNLGAVRLEENALWNFAPHDFSLILSIAGETPTYVTCEGGAYVTPGVADLALTTIHFNSPLKAHVYVSWLHPYKEQKLIIMGSKGFFVFDDTKPWEEKLLLHVGPVTRNSAGQPIIDPETRAEPVFVPKAEPLKEECLHFLHCCKTGDTPRTDGREGLAVTQILVAADESMKQNGTPMAIT